MQQEILHLCKEPPFSIRAKSALMDEGLETDHEFMKELVEWSKLAPSKVAAEAGLAATTVTRHVNGTAMTRLSRPTILKLQERFPSFPHWPEEYKRTILSEVGQRTEGAIEEMFGNIDLPRIPLVGSVIGMRSFDPERDIELTELDMAEVLDTVRRPDSLARDERAYALTVIGDSMAPKYDPGTRVIVSPKATVSVNDYVVVQLKGEDPEDQYEERITSVLIKRLVRRSASFAELRQFNPDITFRVERDRIAAIHKVIGEVY
jgi:phage repressor protein C with HTH and peptisase S24 domain